MPDAKILIVEDEAIEALDIQRRLVGLGYPLPDIAYSGEEGVKKVEKAQPDLVLMDIMMPGKIDGVAAAEQIRSRFDIPIIFLTAYTDENTLRRAKITAPYGYIVKPFQERELHIAIDMALYRHKMERELRESQNENEFLAGLIRSSSQPVAIGYPDGRLGLFNHAFEELTGYAADELRSLNWVTALTPPEWLEMEREKLAELHHTGQSVHYEKEYIRKDGTRIPIELLVHLVSDSEGTPQYYYAFLTDLTERKQAEEKVTKLNEELRRNVDELSVTNASLRDSRRAALNLMEDVLAARKRTEEANAGLATVNKELDAFSYAVSNDLRAPLRSIEGFSRAIMEDYADKLDATGRDYFLRVTSASRRMMQLIDALLAMSRSTQGEIKEKVVNLSDAVSVIADALKRSQPERAVDFVIAERVSANGDLDMLRIVLENLLNNAWKFTSRHPAARIEFGVTRIDDKDVYFVRDDGAGFDMEFADKLFSPFRRFHGEADFPGIGIGLAIAYKIITRHVGKIWAESAPEKGATFYFTL